MLGLGNNLTSASYVGGFSQKYSLDFDGTDGYVAISDDNSLDLTDDMTLSAWIKYDTISAGQEGIFTKTDGDGNGYGLSIKSDGKVRFFSLHWNTSVAISGSALSSGTWYHVVGVHDNSANTSKIYVDGSLSDTQTSASPHSANTDPLEIGRIFLADGNVFDGHIDEVSIFNAVVDVSTLRDGSKPADLTGMSNLQGWWRMGDGTEGASGTNIYDMSDNSNNGTMTNMDASTDYTADVP